MDRSKEGRMLTKKEQKMEETKIKMTEKRNK
jgi:hypothetical protein